MNKGGSTIFPVCAVDQAWLMIHDQISKQEL